MEVSFTYILLKQTAELQNNVSWYLCFSFWALRHLETIFQIKFSLLWLLDTITFINRHIHSENQSLYLKNATEKPDLDRGVLVFWHLASLLMPLTLKTKQQSKLCDKAMGWIILLLVFYYQHWQEILFFFGNIKTSSRAHPGS
jgi:hypothetical protein